MSRQRRKQRRRDRMCRRFLRARSLEHLAPPLQADLTGHRFMRDIPDAADLDIECIQRQQRGRAGRPAQTRLAR